MYVVRSIDTVANAFMDFYNNTTITAHQLFLFPADAAESDDMKAKLSKAISQHPTVTAVEVSAGSVAQENVYLETLKSKILKNNPDAFQDVANLQKKYFVVVIDNFDPAADTPEQAPMHISDINNIFPNQKILLVYLHKVVADANRDGYTNAIMNKCVKVTDENRVNSWSVITSQITSPFITTEGTPDTYSAAISTLKETLEEQRDFTVLVVDNAYVGDSGVISEMNSVDKTKPFVILIDNFNMSSSLITRELLKYRATEMQNRQSDTDFPTCKFFIARPKAKIYLSYMA